MNPASIRRRRPLAVMSALWAPHNPGHMTSKAKSGQSLLVGFGPGTQVIGWDSVPPADRPRVV